MPRATLFIIGFAVLITTTLAIDLAKPIPEIHLKDGTTLRNVEIKSYSATSVMVRHASGAGTIRYEQLPDEIYEAILAHRKESPQVANAIPEDVAAARDFVTCLSSPLPENLMVEKYIGQGGGAAVIRGRYIGDAVSGADRLSDLIVNIRNSPKIVARYAQVTLTNLKRNDQTGELEYEISLAPKRDEEPKAQMPAQRLDPVTEFLELSRDDQLVVLRKGRPRLPSLPMPESNWSEKALMKPQLAGQIFITTKGGATFKMSGVTVKVFPNSYAKTLLSWVTSPSQPAVACMDFYSEHKDSSRGIEILNLIDDLKLSAWASIGAGTAQTTTDADGRFDIASPFSDYAIFATASRKIGDKTEYYVWLLTSDKVPEKDKILLNGSNMIDSWTSTDDR